MPAPSVRPPLRSAASAPGGAVGAREHAPGTGGSGGGGRPGALRAARGRGGLSLKGVVNVAPDALSLRLRDHGAAALSDAELLALWLQGRGNATASLARAQRLLARFGSLHDLFTAPQADGRRIPGLGAGGHARAQASLAIAARVLRGPLVEANVLDSPQRVRDWLGLWLAGRPHEVFVVVFLDARHRLLGEQELFRGTLTQTSVYPREVVKAALAANAAGVLLAHNHPSGVAEPSRADEQLTAVLREALSLVDVRLLDHFVVTRGAVVSFAERGLL